ncbi:MAG: gliding motility-associated-like protein, partial [Bacteroidia bacterium]
NSSWYKNQGNFQQTILGQGTHCDTTYYITIKLLPKPTKSLSFQICEGDSISVYGTWYRWQGLFEQTVSGSLGDCDSTFYIAIGVKSKSQSEIIIDTCQFSKIHFLGQEIFAGSEKYFKFTNHVGCDSILKVKVEANKILYGSQTIASCSTVTYLGKEYEPNSTTNIVFSSAEGCDSVVTLKIIPGNQQTSFLGSDLKVCQPTTALIGLDDKTTWSTGEVSRSIVVSKSGAYSARYKAADGCEHYDEIFVRFIDKSMYIPSAFSPNSDLLNECWKPVFAHPDEVSDYKLYIYNRLGLLVFETDDVNACWDGKYKGETCQNTLFLWIVQGTSIECGVIDERCGYMRINR